MHYADIPAPTSCESRMARFTEDTEDDNPCTAKTPIC
jgi:hypothetical protein